MQQLRERADRLDARVRAGEPVEAERQEALQALQRGDHGLIWRYIPGGRFLMGSASGQTDERPVHPVELPGFWITDVPVSWAHYCALMGWILPPFGRPDQTSADDDIWGPDTNNNNKIRLQYCEDHTLHARDWHAHVPGQMWLQKAETTTAQEFFGHPDREEGPWAYSRKPMVALSWHRAQMLAERLSAPGAPVSLPTEAQWERAARGGLDGQPYPWGDAPPTAERCDFDAFEQLRVLKSRTFPPNAYGVYAMSGGVWEWCKDHYRPDFYAQSPLHSPVCQGDASTGPYVLRGGSWADAAEAVTVSFRMGRRSAHWQAEERGEPDSPNIGFRLVIS